MLSILEKLALHPEIDVPTGEVILEEGGSSDRIFVLAEGVMEVYRGDTSIALINERGALFGEMSVVLDVPHTANVRAASDCKIYIIENARAFLVENPHYALPIAQLLAKRLQLATTYLVDLKQQFADRSDHFHMVDEVLEALLNAQPQPFTAPD